MTPNDRLCASGAASKLCLLASHIARRIILSARKSGRINSQSVIAVCSFRLWELKRKNSLAVIPAEIWHLATRRPKKKKNHKFLKNRSKNESFAPSPIIHVYRTARGPSSVADGSEHPVAWGWAALKRKKVWSIIVDDGVRRSKDNRPRGFTTHYSLFLSLRSS